MPTSYKDAPLRKQPPPDLRVVVEPFGALSALGAGVALLAHAVARLVALLPLAAVSVAAWLPMRWASITLLPRLLN